MDLHHFDWIRFVNRFVAFRHVVVDNSEERGPLRVVLLEFHEFTVPVEILPELCMLAGLRVAGTNSAYCQVDYSEIIFYQLLSDFLYDFDLPHVLVHVGVPVPH